jgi:hypothetical protein
MAIGERPEAAAAAGRYRGRDPGETDVRTAPRAVGAPEHARRPAPAAAPAPAVRRAWRRGLAWGLAVGVGVTLAVSATFAWLYGAALLPAPVSGGGPTPAATVPAARSRPFSITVNNVEAAQQVGPHAPSGPDALFVVADVTVENNGDGAVAYGPHAFRLVDAQGYEYGTSWTAAANPRRLMDGALEPGARARGVLVFELPRDSAGLVLQFRPPSTVPGETVRVPL